MWIEELSNGKFKYFERYRDPLTEKLKKVSVTLDKKTPRAQKTAQAELADKISKILAKKEGSDITFYDLYNEYYKNWSPTVKASSLRGTTANDKRILNKIGKDVKAKNVNRRIIQNLVNEMMDEGYAYSYYNGFKKRFHSILDFGVRMGYLEVNEAIFVKAPKKIKTFDEVQEKRESYLELNDIKKLLSVLRVTPRVEHIANFVEFMAYTGARYGETAALTVDEIDLETGTVTINGTYDRALKIKTTPKTDFSYRTITIPDNIKKIIQEQLELISLHRSVKGNDFNKENYIFFTVNGAAIDLDTLNVVVRRAAEKAGITKHITSHIFRHSHIALLAEIGIPLSAAMDRVGHTDYKTTLSIYSHVTKSVKIDIVKQLNDLI
ncbi:tyrosine-type recombinase/integrase [Lactococcus lactis]|uniref:Integrase n=1 Tax=Lactococcus lactis TaxID=1358 RepID=A0AAW5TPF9_9LACT|nr:site-specific integrase [Lactococcus lactis]MCW2280456.1 integrase [Lactococcus lactis]